MPTPVTTRFLARLEALIQKGDRVIASDHPPPEYVIAANSVDDALFHEWRNQSLAFLVDLLGARHVYARSFEERCKDGYTYEARAGQAILRAVKEDLAAGDLASLAELVHQDVFSDFLEMADYLLKDGGYKDPAAVLAGGVLEGHLRNLCQKHGIAVQLPGSGGPRPKKADAMNADLAGAGVYGKLDQKTVTAWLDLRNKAAHAEYTAYTREQAALLIQGLREFIARNPA